MTLYSKLSGEASDLTEPHLIFLTAKRMPAQMLPSVRYYKDSSTQGLSDCNFCGDKDKSSAFIRLIDQYVSCPK